jgi:hypothetical protein
MKKPFLVVLIFAVALAWWIPRQVESRRTEQALQDSENKLAALRHRLANAESALNSARQEQGAQNRAHAQTTAAVDAARHALSIKAPETQWLAPPASLPKWETDSPFVWVRKDFLRELNLQVFAQDGAIRRAAAELLGVDKSTQAAINGQIQQALSNYHAIQLAKAEVSSAPPASGQGNGPTVTVQIPAMPDQGAALTGQITQILQQNLGGQRAQLVASTAELWLNDFSSTQALLVSVTPQTDGNYHLEMQLPNGSSSTYGGIPAARVQQLVPDYLLPLLADAFQQSGDAPNAP